jgi:VanZ like family
MRDSRLSATLEDGGQHGADAPEPTATKQISFHPWYGLAMLLYMVGITLLSSVPRNGGPRHPLLEYGLNLGHIPLFAGLTFLLVKTIAPKKRQFLATRACAGAAVLLVAFAALDEWHQVFVPGRQCSVMDLLLDAMGIGAVLLFYRLSALVSEGS